MKLSPGSLYLAAGIATLLTVSHPAHTQGYPSRPITMIVPFPAGGGTDVNARIVSEHMSRTLPLADLLKKDVARWTQIIRAARVGG